MQSGSNKAVFHSVKQFEMHTVLFSFSICKQNFMKYYSVQSFIKKMFSDAFMWCFLLSEVYYFFNVFFILYSGSPLVKLQNLDDYHDLIWWCY